LIEPPVVGGISPRWILAGPFRKVSARGAHGRFVVVEPMHDCSRGLTREKQVAQHDIAIEIVDEELRAAGFEVVERDTSFIKFTAVPGGFWLLVARRP